MPIVPEKQPQAHSRRWIVIVPSAALGTALAVAALTTPLPPQAKLDLGFGNWAVVAADMPRSRPAGLHQGLQVINVHDIDYGFEGVVVRIGNRAFGVGRTWP